MKFTKMHGCGNDYVYVDCFHEKYPENPSALSIEISKPHTGVSSDGLILIEPCEGADARMRIFNKDGSEGEMCGNGVRCVGKYLYDSGICRRDVINVMTGGGLKVLEMTAENGVATAARVNMGKACFDSALIPVAGDSNRITLAYPGGEAEFFCVNVGNPHAVTLSLHPDERQFFELGPYFENHPAFPKRANISFCRVIDNKHLETRIWERGSGPTMACGTGATATLTAAYKLGACDSSAYVKLPGGELFIEYDEKTGNVFMTGPATTSFTGEWPDT